VTHVVFWLALLVGALFARTGIRIGFVKTWIVLFNVVVAVYIAVAVTPVFCDMFSRPRAGSDVPALALFGIASGACAALHAVAYAMFRGGVVLSLPKAVESVGAGLLGFCLGFLLVSFLGLVICLAPFAQHPLALQAGLGPQSQQTNLLSVCWSFDVVNAVVNSGERRISGRDAIVELLALQPKSAVHGAAKAWERHAQESVTGLVRNGRLVRPARGNPFAVADRRWGRSRDPHSCRVGWR
jgi:hypothetical protein